MTENYCDTTSKLAREAQVTYPTIRKYADLGLLDFIVASNGVRLFRPGQADRVRKIYAERMNSRGRPRVALG
jgi:DNA-binding transcriptional MerR regulator